MTISDTLDQAWGNLRKKRLRTFLTTGGVVIGVGALVCMFAFGQGVQRNVKAQFEALELFNYITVSGADNPRRGRRFQPEETPDVNATGPVLDDTFLQEVLTIPGVETAFPEARFPAQIRLAGRERFTLVQVVSAQVCRSELVQLRAGVPYASDEPNELVVSDAMLRRLGVDTPETLLGQSLEVRTLILDFSPANLLRMVFASQALPFSNQSYSFKIVGIAQRMRRSGGLPIRSDVMIPPGPAARMKKLELTNLWDFFEPAPTQGAYASVSVRVASPADVPSVQKKLEDQGFRTFALMDEMAEMRKGFIMMDMFLMAVGMIGVTIASLGIVNTMVMSILERYRDIGIMKAVGATDRDVQTIFLCESGMIGLLGGIFGLILAWVVSLIIGQVVNRLAARQDIDVPSIDYFHFAWWLCLSAILFSIVISLLAGLYPTRRAARVDPVVALRHD